MNQNSENSLNSFPLNESIFVTPRFTRSVRIDRDDYADFLKGFIYTPSCAALLKDMANFVRNGERAFTWTGPFGTGKSSSVLFLQALLSGNGSVRRKVKALCGEDYDTIRKGFKAGKNGWEIVSVVGRRESPLTTLAKALGLPETIKDENDIILFCEQKIKNGIDGILIAIDEMGKFLEHAAFSGRDIYPFQQLAELAARGTGRIVLLGVLHQNFAEYAKRVSRDVQGEWNKIQGRFHDFSYNPGREESIAMLGQAITSRNTPPVSFITNTEKVISTITKNREITDSNYLKEILIDAYPLHPVTTLLLGPFSRHSFSQNQRSLFGFLNSVETGGFQEFLERAESENVYTPVMFWDYLAYNFEPVIMASSLSHRWALALENIHRSDKQGGDKPHRDLIKVVALIELFSEYSGLRAELDVLKASLLSYSQSSIDKIISDLEKWKILLYRKHMEAYSLFSGSDFDLDNALATAESHFLQMDFSLIKEMADLKPVIAKRHHLKTGTIRWYETDMIIRHELSSTLVNYSLGKYSAGLFLFVISDEYGCKERNSIEDELSSIQYKNFPVLIGFLESDSHFSPILKEIQLLSWIEHYHSELSGDPVARYEVESRKQYLVGRVKESITSSIMAVRWRYWGLDKEYNAEGKSANVIASELADRIYDKSPIIHNEIANRIKPSGSTNAAMKQLLRCMVNLPDQPRLGIEGFPAEGGLYVSLLERTRLHREKEGVWGFYEPNDQGQREISRLKPLWNLTDELMKKSGNHQKNLKEIFAAWEMPPFGVKPGIMPVLMTAYLQIRRKKLAVYMDGNYQVALSEILVENLLKDPSSIALRTVNLNEAERDLLKELTDFLPGLTKSSGLTFDEPTPLEVARALVSFVLGLPKWVLNTSSLSPKTIKLRELLKNAHDPNKTLFDDLTPLYVKKGDREKRQETATVIRGIVKSLNELAIAYPEMLKSLRDQLTEELGVKDIDKEEVFREKATALYKNRSGNYRVDAFAMRLRSMEGSDGFMESLAGFLANKPVDNWIDTDLSAARMELSALSRQFNAKLSLVRVKGKLQKKGEGVQKKELYDTIKNCLREIKDPYLKLEAIVELGEEVLEELEG